MSRADSETSRLEDEFIRVADRYKASAKACLIVFETAEGAHVLIEGEPESRLLRDLVQRVAEHRRRIRQEDTLDNLIERLRELESSFGGDK